MVITRLITLLAIVLGVCGSDFVAADVKLPKIIDSHMVVQRDVPLRLWGWADAGEKVTVSINSGDAVSTTANGEGKWIVECSPQQADGKPRSITITGNNKIELEDVLVGEVWIGSGQSNMEWQLRNTQNAPAAIAAATHPEIRLFHVPKVQKDAAADDVVAAWKASTPEAVPNFSAVLYYFGKKLHTDLDVPIGLINSSWGGSPIEPWINTSGQSGKMYNGMIAPLTNFAVRGAIWYQGETNVLQKNGLRYYDKMQALVNGWRTAFGNSHLAFGFVQIAPWAGRYEAGELPALWEAQAASLKIPGTGMVVTTDLVDNIKDIHPRNKLDVGNRLALWALARVYEREGIVYSGPLYKSHKVEGDSIRLQFAHTAAGLKSRDGKPLTEFQIAGADGEFVAAEAKVDGTNVVVHAAAVTAPKQVRFGWHKLANPNLVNSAGLPASPFQTDGWTGGTGEKAN